MILSSGDSEFLQPETSGSDPALWDGTVEVISLRDSVPLVPNRPGRDKGLWLLASRKRRRYDWLALSSNASTLTDTAHLQHQALFECCKRLVDVLASLALMVVLGPLFLIIAIVISCDSRGPVLFRQSRVGRNGIRFTMWKFRSMYTHAKRYARSPQAPSDPRITRVGRFLRRTSIDELPQLWNVLIGEMSLVGPRPEMPFIAARYSRAQRQRLLVKPGMTGLWQIGPARSQPIHHNLHLDLHYIRNRNMLLDLVILFRTINVVISGAQTL